MNAPPTGAPPSRTNIDRFETHEAIQAPYPPLNNCRTAIQTIAGLLDPPVERTDAVKITAGLSRREMQGLPWIPIDQTKRCAIRISPNPHPTTPERASRREL